MKNINDITIKYMQHYAIQLKNLKIQKILEKKYINSDDDAKIVMIFLDDLTEQIKKDTLLKKIILINTITLNDGIDICDNMEQDLNDLGYANIVEQYKPNTGIDWPDD